MTSITCPVCNYEGLVEDSCPNCRTDMSTLQMLGQLEVFVKYPNYSAFRERSALKLALGAIVAMLIIIVFQAYRYQYLSALRLSQADIQEQVSEIEISYPMTLDEAKQRLDIQRERIKILESQIETIPSLKSKLDQYYQVQSGDNLHNISDEIYGSSSKVFDIVKLNPRLGRDSDLLIPGEILYLPPFENE